MTPYERGDPIYRFVDGPKEVFLVIRGKVLVYLLAQNDRRFLLDIYAPDDFFGLSVLLPSRTVPEQAVAMEKCEVMSWNVAQIQQFENERPQLGLALVQMLARRSFEHARILANGPFDCLRRSNPGLAQVRPEVRITNTLMDGSGCPPLLTKCFRNTSERIAKPFRIL
jgi:CRP-like cAMP-binding protein